MADIRVRNLSQEAAESCYEAYLKGERPKEGTILVSGPVVVFTSDTFEMKGETLEDGEEKFVSILDNEAKSRAALCEYKNGRRLPAGAALAAMKEGYFAFQSEYMNEEGTPFTLSFDPLEEVMTALFELQASVLPRPVRKYDIFVSQLLQRRRRCLLRARYKFGSHSADYLNIGIYCL